MRGSIDCSARRARELGAPCSPKKIDVIDLEADRFKTLELRALLRECGQEYPAVQELVSVYDHDRLRRPSGLGPDFERDDVLLTFEGLLSGTPFLPRMRAPLCRLPPRLRRGRSPARSTGAGACAWPSASAPPWIPSASA